MVFVHQPVSLMKTLSFYMSWDYLSLKILYVFGLIQSWNPKFRKQLCLLCLTILLSRSRCEFNFVYIFYCYRAYLCKLLGLDKYVPGPTLEFYQYVRKWKYYFIESPIFIQNLMFMITKAAKSEKILLIKIIEIILS